MAIDQIEKAMDKLTTGYELILNACESTLQIAVTENEQVLCFEEWFTPAKATEILAPALAEIFQRLDINSQAFRRIGCFAGPGSFTGIRLVLTTATALRRSSSAQLARLDYLQALATSAAIRRGWLYPGRIFVVTHARRDLVHFQPFISYGPQIPAQPLEEVRLISPAQALALMAGDTCLVCGSAIIRHPQYFDLPVTGKGPKEAPNAILLTDLANPDLAALCMLARHGEYFPQDVQPNYVRGCDAENLLDTGGKAMMAELMQRNAGEES